MLHRFQSHRVKQGIESIGLGVLLLALGCGSAGTFTSPTPPVAPSPAVTVTVTGSAQTRLGTTTQFTATVANTTNTAVTWQVDGVTGGSSAAGTISSTGLYTPPAAIPTGGTVTVSAISQASSTASGTLSEAVWNPVPVLTSAAATQTGTSTTYLLDVLGSSFVQGAQIQVGGASVTTNYISATEVQATLTAAAGTSSIAVDVLNPAPGAAATATSNVAITVVTVTVSAASRLLDQATFGPTLTDIQHIQSVGLNNYITEQFQQAPTVLPDIASPPPAFCSTAPRPCEESEWWQAAITGPDQLRQRVAFALGEMFVVSSNSISPYAVIPFQNILTQDAFGNFQTLMKDVTLSVAMGGYLNMLNSGKPADGQIANENYPREFMQLFTIGLNQLNPDGSLQLDSSGNPIPTYTEAQVQAFARAYTGWTMATATGGAPTRFPNASAGYDYPMQPFASQHDETAKVLLGGTTLPANQTAQQDLAGAIANLFAQPNVGPFVCRQLIQHLVASNPSPAYVGRVAARFADNGNGVRGDMQAVVRAILMDPEARAGDTDPTQNGGHLREPILYVANVIRGLSYGNTDSQGNYSTLSNYSGNLGERPYESPSVFNFFPPSYVIPDSSINAPEFAEENTATATLRLTLANSVVYNSISGFKTDLSATSALGLMAANPANLVDSLGTMFMHAQMPTNMRSAIISQITPLTDLGERVRVATYLVITSSQYKIEH